MLRPDEEWAWPRTEAIERSNSLTWDPIKGDWVVKKKTIHGPTKRRKLIPQLAARDGWHCYWCKVELSLAIESLQPYPTIDHLIPLSKGGSNKKYNLVLACEPCNQEKADMMPDEYRAHRERMS